MARDCLMTVGNHIIETPFAWQCRSQEIELAFSRIFDTLAQDPSVRVICAPKRPVPDTIYDGLLIQEGAGSKEDGHKWAINNTRPALDAADFVRVGKTLLGQLSHVTNEKGVEWLRQVLPDGYTVELVEVNNPQAMHIGTALLPLREGVLLYNLKHVTEQSLKKHAGLKDWVLFPC